MEKAESEDSFSEKDVVFLLWDILDAIRYCHDVKHVVHRYVLSPLASQLYHFLVFLSIDFTTQNYAALSSLVYSFLYINTNISFSFDSKTNRDLKPENFLLKDDSDSRPFIKIIDFGLSRKDDQPTGLMGSKVGTVSKMCSVCARY